MKQITNVKQLGNADIGIVVEVLQERHGKSSKEKVWQRGIYLGTTHAVCGSKDAISMVRDYNGEYRVTQVCSNKDGSVPTRGHLLQGWIVADSHGNASKYAHLLDGIAPERPIQKGELEKH